MHEPSGTSVPAPSRKRIALALCVLAVCAAGFFILRKTVFSGAGAAPAERAPLVSVGRYPADQLTEPAAQPDGGRISFADILSFVSGDDRSNGVASSSTSPAQSSSAPKYKVYSSPASILDRPIIESVSPDHFGSGDTVVIHGRNFTKWNTVVLSVDLRNKFAGIVSPDGTTITFKPSLTLTENFRRSFSRLSAENRAKVVAHIIAVNGVKTGESSAWHMPAELSVSNENGESSTVPVYVDVLKGL